MAKEIYLTQYGLMAERHWREFRANMAREVEAKGTLMEALFEAQDTTLDEMETLTRQLETEQKMTHALPAPCRRAARARAANTRRRVIRIGLSDVWADVRRVRRSCGETAAKRNAAPVAAKAE